jgi:hypothetical protein
MSPINALIYPCVVKLPTRRSRARNLRPSSSGEITPAAITDLTMGKKAAVRRLVTLTVAGVRPALPWPGLA